MRISRLNAGDIAAEAASVRATILSDVATGTAAADPLAALRSPAASAPAAELAPASPL